MSPRDAQGMKKTSMEELLFEEVNFEGGSVLDLTSGQARGFEDAQHKEGWKQAIMESPKALIWC